jgi:hypothetical protein
MYQQGYMVLYWPEKVLRHRGSDYPGKAASVIKFNCANELKTIRRLYPVFVWPIYFTGKAALWFYRILRSGQFFLLKEVVRNVWADRKTNRPEGRIGWHVLQRINAIRYGRMDVLVNQGNKKSMGTHPACEK